MTPSGSDERIEVRLDARQSERLDALARETSRARPELIGEAIDAYLAQQEDDLRAIAEGLADARAGRFASHERPLMSDSKIALALGFAGLMMMSAILWHRDATRCRIIESDPLGIIAPR